MCERLVENQRMSNFLENDSVSSLDTFQTYSSLYEVCTQYNQEARN